MPDPRSATLLLKSISRLCFLLLLISKPVIAEIILPQADGTTLKLESSTQRLITLSPHLAELVFAAGAGAQLLATVEYSEYPAAVADIPRVGDAFRIDVERITALKPDLVMAWDSGNPGQAIDQLRSLGVPVWSIEIRDPVEIANVIENIGTAAETAEVAGPAAQAFRHRLNKLSSDYASRETLEYFYQIASRPLFTINGEHLISIGLSLCGGHNIFAEQPGLAFQVSYESVIVADPDALLAPALESDAGPLDAWLEWPGMQAVQDKSLFLLPADEISRATPRLLEALELACSLLDGLRTRNSHE